MTVLHRLIRAGMKRKLLDALANMPADELFAAVNAPDGESLDTPLIEAVRANMPDIIPALAKAGANPSLRNFREESPLDVAVANNAFECAKALLEAGADAGAPRPVFGMTPLMLAAAMDNPAMIGLLLAHGADISATHPENGKNVFCVAAGYGATKAMALLLKQDGAAGAVTGIGRGVESPLRSALARGDLEMAGMLLDFGVSVNEQDENGETPLFHVLGLHADRDVAMKALRFLVERGADVEKARNMWDENALFPALRSSFTEAVALLLDHGVDPAHQSRLQETPLHVVAGTWDGESARSLIKAGAALGAKDGQGRTALHIAAYQNKEAVVRVLLAAGADPFAANREGKKPSDLTPAHFQDGVRRLLLQKEEELEIKRYGRDMYNRRKMMAENGQKPQFTHPSSKHPFKHGKNRR